MSEAAIYIIKSAVILSLLFSAYKLTAGRLKCHPLRRAILLGIYGLSAVIPLSPILTFNKIEDTTIQNVILLPRALTENVETVERIDTSSIYFSLITIVMFTGIVIASLMTVAGIIRIVKCRRNGENERIDNLPVTIVDSPSISPFSFGGRIFLSRRDFDERCAMIIAHEASHVRHHHYIDLLAGRLISAMQWWNPLAWLMLKELHAVHEFQADADVLNEGFDTKEYQYLLLDKATGIRIQTVADNFNSSKLKERLIMINRKDTSIKRQLISLSIIPAAIGGFLLVTSDSFAGMMEPFNKCMDLRNLLDERTSNQVDRNPESLANPDDELTPDSTVVMENDFVPDEAEKEMDMEVNNSHAQLPDRSTRTIGDEGLPSGETTDDEPVNIPSQTQSKPEKIIIKMEESNNSSDGTVVVKDDETIVSYSPTSFTPRQPQPDYEMDGKLISETDLKSINVDIIESITVLKDTPEHPNGIIKIKTRGNKES